MFRRPFRFSPVCFEFPLYVENCENYRENCVRDDNPSYALHDARRRRHTDARRTVLAVKTHSAADARNDYAEDKTFNYARRNLDEIQRGGRPVQILVVIYIEHSRAYYKAADDALSHRQKSSAAETSAQGLLFGAEPETLLGKFRRF